MRRLTYLSGYAESLLAQVRRLIEDEALAGVLRSRYPVAHQIRTDRALYEFAMELKNRYLRNAAPISKVAYDGKIGLVHNALGLHSYHSRVQGGKLKSKNEIRIASLFRLAPPEFLRMIVVHELAHLKEREHGKSFYQLCEHMEPAYHQLEFDTRLYLTLIDLGGSLYPETDQPGEPVPGRVVDPVS